MCPHSDAPGETVREAAAQPRQADEVTLFLCGDVMTGRGIDQILPHPGDPRLYESYMVSAVDYVGLAERKNGPIPRPVDFAYIWGDALTALDRQAPALRLINLETAVTTSDNAQPKGINYRMHPANLPVLQAAGVAGCVLANNHVLDWGAKGLLETLAVLERAGLRYAGAGRDLNEASAPACFTVPGGRLWLLALGLPSSGVPAAWAATRSRPGVNFLPDLSPETADAIATELRARRAPGDVVLVSLHWGGNWGYAIDAEQRTFARRLIDGGGVDIVWGHSSHHPRGIEVYCERLILYGCGDLINDYEGITGYEAYRDDLVLMYFPTLRLADGALVRLTMVPMQLCRLRLNRATHDDARWLRDVLSREGRRLATAVRLDAQDHLILDWC